MLDAENFRRLVLRHTGLIYLVFMEYHFEGEALHDNVAQFWAWLWARREKWPIGGPENEVAFLRKQARARAEDKKRDDGALKRGAEYTTVSLHRADGRDPASAKHGGAFRGYRDDDETLDRALIARAIRVVAATLSTESEAVILARLNDSGSRFSKVTEQRAVRSFRRAADVPVHYPQRAGIADMGEHVIKAARRIEAEGAKHPDDIELFPEVTCATEIWENSHATARSTSGARQSPGEPAPYRTATSSNASPLSDRSRSESDKTPISRGCERTPSSRSRRPPSVSARSRRPALFDSTTAKKPTPTIFRAVMSRPERTAVTKNPLALEEDSSVSGSRG